MSLTRNNMKSQVTKLIATIAVAGLLYACATSPPTSLGAMKTKQIQELATTCYVDNNDNGLAYGPGRVWQACREWAESQVHKTPAAPL